MYVLMCAFFWHVYICSAQSENWHNLEIALRVLRILKLRSSLEIAQPIQKDCVIYMRNLCLRTLMLQRLYSCTGSDRSTVMTM